MSSKGITRRQFVGAGVAGTMLSCAPAGMRQTSSTSDASHKLYWGDLHNHNAVGYAKGSLERSIDLARAHLDFFAFTGHASWHDMPKMPGDRHMKWVNGFEANRKHWPRTKRMIKDATTKDFVAFAGYEWHSSTFGDYCVFFPGEDSDLFLPDHADKLLDFAEKKGALAIPHHVGYKLDWRGINWKYVRTKTVSPVVEIYSEHGCTESDRSPYPMIRHSNGGRSTSQTILPHLMKGMRFGFVASTDDHLGYPGAYGEGVVGVWAEDLTSKGIFDALRARRTVAATGDRIALEVSVNGKPMGSELPATADRQIDVRVEGQDSIAMIELLRNGRVIQRHFPQDEARPPKFPGRAKCRLQYGWGPWAALNLGRICHWDMTVRIDGGKFRTLSPCFQTAPFGEDFRDRLQVVSETEFRLQSPTTRVECYAEDPTKSVVCDVEGGADAALTVILRQPVEHTLRARLVDLAENSRGHFTGVFTTESYILHRLVSPSEFATRVRWTERRDPQPGGDSYYVRVTQHNGQLAWSSPIWIG